MDYPIQVWYGVLFTGEEPEKPALPDRADYRPLGPDLVWIHCGKWFGLAVTESVQTIWEVPGELTNYPEDVASTWSALLAGALSVLDIGAARITWYASTAAQ